MIEPRYLGDGVYAEVESGMIKLTTRDGARVTNTIYLEPDVFDALDTFVDDAVAAMRAAAEGGQPT